MKRMIAVTALALSVMTGAANAADQPAVVELFTSQGCSSCPPADALLGELARRGTVLALAYHVDYWDHLGWKDPFASAAATERQRGYARSLGLRDLHTPQMVVDGGLDLVGSDRASVLAAVAAPRQGPELGLTLRDGALTVTLPAQAAAPAAQVILVAYTREALTKVVRGENAGRSLTEYAIVRAVHPLGDWRGEAGRYSFDMSGLPADATAIAVLLQERGQGRILSAASAVIHGRG